MVSPRLLQVHRYVALSLGILAVVMGLTGAGLVFRDELTATFTPAARIAPGAAQPGDYQRILAAARGVDPAARSLDIVPATQERAAEVILHGSERYLFVDPRSGRIVADSEREWLPFATFYEIHRRFLAGEAGESVPGIAGLALAFLAISGLVMAWPRKWKNAFRVRWDGNPMAVSFDLHRCVGLAFALFLIVNAITGASMAFDGASVWLVNGISGASPPAIPAAASDAFASAKPLDDIVAAAERALPGGRVTRIAIRPGNAPVVVRKRLDADNATHGMNRIYVDAASATVLRADPLRGLAPGNAMFEWLYPMHTGKLFGLPYKILLLLVGLAPAVSFATGVILWRLRAKRRTAVKTVAAQAAS